MQTKGTVQLGLKVSPELRELIRKHEIDVMATCRKALLAAVVRKAGRKALGLKDKPKKKPCPGCKDRYGYSSNHTYLPGCRLAK